MSLLKPVLFHKSVAMFSIGYLALLPRLTNGDTKYSASLRITSNYMYRGYSKSDGHPAIQGNIDYQHRSGFFIGSWISQVDFGERPSRYRKFNDRANIEANPYAGVSLGLFENWRIEAALAGYLYDGEVYGRKADYGELYGLLHFRDLVTARLGVSYDAYGRGKSILDYAVDARFPLTDTIEVSGGVGYEDANAVLNSDYIYWNIGATWFLHRHAAIDLRYYETHRFNTLETHRYGAGALEEIEHDLSGDSAGFELPAIDTPLVVSISIGF